MKLRTMAYGYIIILAIMVLLIVLSLQLDAVKSKLLPLMVAGLTFILAAVGLVNELKIKGERKMASSGEIEADKEEVRKGWRGYLTTWGWLLGFLGAIYLFGFLIAIPLLVFGYMRFLGTKWHVAIISAVVTDAIIWGVFAKALGVIFYKGVFFS